MLAPHDREDAQLGVARFTPQNDFDLLVLVRGEVVFPNEFRGNGWFAHRLLGGSHQAARAEAGFSNA
jgi:hypothetical protein